MNRTVDISGVRYELGDTKTLIDVSGDMGWHGGAAASESWFLVANLKSQNDRIGLQVQALLNEIPQQPKVLTINASLVNEAIGWYKSFEYVYPVNETTIAKDNLNLQAPHFSLAGNTDGMSTFVEAEGATIDIHSKNVNPALLTNGEGYMNFLGVGQYEY